MGVLEGYSFHTALGLKAISRSSNSKCFIQVYKQLYSLISSSNSGHHLQKKDNGKRIQAQLAPVLHLKCRKVLLRCQNTAHLPALCTYKGTLALLIPIKE